MVDGSDEVEVWSRASTSASLADGSNARDEPEAAWHDRVWSGLRDGLIHAALFASGRLVIDPGGRFSRWWECFALLVVMWSIISAPWFAALDPVTGHWLMPLDLVLMAWMALDILVRMRTAFVEHGGALVFDSKDVAARFVRSRGFTLDMLALAPFEFLAYVLPQPWGDPRFTVAFWYTMIKLKHLLRIHRVFGSKLVDSAFRTSQMRVLQIFLAWALMAHFCATLLVFIGKNQADADKSNWMAASGLHYNGGRTGLYICGLYWAILIMSSVGYGDAHPVTMPERTVSLFILLLALCFYAAIFGAIATSITAIQVQVRKFQSVIDSTKEYGDLNDLPSSLRDKMRRYAMFDWSQNHGFRPKTFLADLPLSVQSEVLLYIHASLVQRVPFFRCCSDRFLEAAILRMVPQVVLEGDYVYREGDKSRDMYFLQNGSVEILMDDPVTASEQCIGRLATFSAAPHFGELALLLGTTRTASVRATCPTVLIRLSMEAFFELLTAFPDEESSLREEAVRRLQADLERIKKSQLKKAARVNPTLQLASPSGNATASANAARSRRANVTAASAAQMVIMARIVQLQTAKLGQYGEPEASQSTRADGDADASPHASPGSSSDSDSDDAAPARSMRVLPPPVTVPAPPAQAWLVGRRSPFISPKLGPAASAANAVTTPPALSFGDAHSAYPLSAATATAAAATAAAAAAAAAHSPSQAGGRSVRGAGNRGSGRSLNRSSYGRGDSGVSLAHSGSKVGPAGAAAEEYKESCVVPPASPSRAASPAFFIPGDMSHVQSQSRLMVRASHNHRMGSIETQTREGNNGGRDRSLPSSIVSSPTHGGGGGGGYLPVSPFYGAQHRSPSHGASSMMRGDSLFQLPGRVDDVGDGEDDSPAKKQQRMVQLLRHTSTRRQNTGNSLLLPPSHYSTGSSSSLLVPPRSAGSDKDKRASFGGLDLDVSTNSSSGPWIPSPSNRSRPSSPRLHTPNREAAVAKSDLLARLATTSTRALLADSVARAAAAADAEDSPRRSARPDGGRNSSGGDGGPPLARYGTNASTGSIGSPMLGSAVASPPMNLGRGLSSPSLAPMQSHLNLLALPLDPAAASVRRVSLREEEQLDALAQLRMRRDNTVKRSSLKRQSGGAEGGGARSSGGWRGSGGGAGGSIGKQGSGSGGLMASIRGVLASVPAAAQDSTTTTALPSQSPPPAGNQAAPRANEQPPSPTAIPQWLAQRVSSRPTTQQQQQAAGAGDSKPASPLQMLPPQYPRRASSGANGSNSPPLPQRTKTLGATGLSIAGGAGGMGNTPPHGSPARSAREQTQSPPPPLLPSAIRYTQSHAPLQRQGAQLFNPPLRSGSLPASPERDYRRLAMAMGDGDGGSATAVSLPLPSSDSFRPVAAVRGTSTTSSGSGTATPVRTRPSSGADVLTSVATPTPQRAGRSNKVAPRPLNAF